MELRVSRQAENEIVIEITGEDDTLGNLIAKEAMKHPKVVYASYRIPHPLQNRLEIVITVEKGVDVGEVLSEIVTNIKNILADFRREVESKI